MSQAQIGDDDSSQTVTPDDPTFVELDNEVVAAEAAADEVQNEAPPTKRTRRGKEKAT